MPESPSPSLVRVIGRWSLTALTINSVIGSGIFGLPSSIAGLLGKASPWAVLLAGCAITVIVGCYAELAARFTSTGGAYLYVRTAFGRLAGIEVGWMLWLTALAAAAANANLFVVYLGEFWSLAKEPLPKAAVLTALLAAVTFVNYIGVRTGVQASNLFTVAKTLPLGLLIVAGLGFLIRHPSLSVVTIAPTGAKPWIKSVFLMFFAYGGFEHPLAMMGEVKNPRRDGAFAVLTAMAICTLIYTLVQWVIIGVVPAAAHTSRPVAEAARIILGGWGASLIALGAMVSCYGYLSAKTLAVPRHTFALGQSGDFPRWFGVVHPRFKTPHISIAVFGALVLLLALFGSFAWNVTLSVVSRLFYYGLGCAALPVLRRTQPEGASFRIPAGNAVAVLGVLICIGLLTQVDPTGALILGATVLIAVFNWMVVRKRPQIETPAT